MKTLFFTLLIGLFFSCEKNSIMEEVNPIKTTEPKAKHAKTKNALIDVFGEGLAKLLKESTRAREIIKEESIKKINHDYDVLYYLIKDKTLENGNSFEDCLLKYVELEDLSDIKTLMPTLTVFVPELPENSFSADKWDFVNEIPDVAIRLKRANKVTAYTGDGERYFIEGNHIPGYPIVVVKENERIEVFDINTKTNTPVIKYPNSDLNFRFTDKVFDNISKKNTTKGGVTSTPIPDQLAKIYEAYSLYQGTDGWQRDHVYYNISPSNQRGSFKNNFKEHLLTFKMRGDPWGAYQKISDGDQEPKYIPHGPTPGGGRAIDWTDGEFEFKVLVHYGCKLPIGSILTTSFRARPSDLFDTHFEVVTSRGNTLYIQNGIYGFNRHSVDLPLFEWNLENYTPVIKIGIEEVDATLKTIATNQTTTEYAANFEYNISSGEIDKVGMKFGASTKETRMSSFVIERTEGNDELGEVVINFADNIIISGEPLSFYEPRRGITYYYPQYNPKYYTGWYEIEVAPIKSY